MKKFLFTMIVILYAANSYASSKDKVLPRFVSIKSSEANSRKGPGHQYQPVHLYQYKGLPVEVIAEFEQWRQIRDIDGDEGWIHTSILSAKRSVIIKTTPHELMYKSDDLRSRIIAKLEQNLVCSLYKCVKSWCKIKCKDKKGWVNKSAVWGVYENDEF